jgi:acetate kinase
VNLPAENRVAAMVIERPDRSCLLTVNGGSSSLKFALFPRDARDRPQPILSGRIERIGLPEARARLSDPSGAAPRSEPVSAPDLETAANWLIDWLEDQDPRAAEAVALFVYRAKQGVGALVAALGGLDVLVLASGIGENSPDVRPRICAGLEFLAIALDERRNASTAPLISTDLSRVQVRVIPTDEESMMAKAAASLLAPGL